MNLFLLSGLIAIALAIYFGTRNLAKVKIPSKLKNKKS